MKFIVQIGYQKTAQRRREGQLIRAWINDEECSWQDKCGKYLTSRLESSKGILWYLWKGEADSGDVIRISVKTSLVNVGADERRTFESLYYLSPGAPVREIEVKGVGCKGYPLLKGRVLEMASVSEQDKRESEVDEFLRGDFD